MMRDGKTIAGRIAASVILTLAVSLPAWGSVAPSQNVTFRVPHVPGAWFVRTPGEMIRGSRQRTARVVMRAAPEGDRTARADARTSTPVPPPSAHRTLPRGSGAVVTQDDGPARRRLSSVWVADTSTRLRRVAQTRAREIADTGHNDAGDSIFHEAHAPPLSSSFVGSRS